MPPPAPPPWAPPDPLPDPPLPELLWVPRALAAVDDICGGTLSCVLPTVVGSSTIWLSDTCSSEPLARLRVTLTVTL
jgi:hypothetical protein